MQREVSGKHGQTLRLFSVGGRLQGERRQSNDRSCMNDLLIPDPPRVVGEPAEAEAIPDGLGIHHPQVMPRV